MAERVPLGSLGRHPVGNLLIRSLVKSSGGDLQTAIDGLATRLGVRGRVVCATVGEVSLIGVARGELLFGESAIGAAAAPVDRLRFSPRRPQVSPVAIDAVSRADVVLLGPGSLFTSVLAVAALPALKAALTVTPAQIVWVCNLTHQPGETRSLSGAGHLEALRRAGVRVDAVLQDPGAAVHLTTAEIARAAVEVHERALAADDRQGAHDPARLRSALREMVHAACEVASATGLNPPQEMALA
jgi:uncharacterized cofD-like protein